MKSKSLTLISFSHTATPRDLVESVCHHWSPVSRPTLSSSTVDQILGDATLLDDSGVAWIFVDNGPVDRLYELVELLQDRHVPAMLTRQEETHEVATPFQDGVVIGPPQTSPLALCGVLRTLWAQAEQVRELQTEVAILRAHQGGLCDQIDKIDEELRLAAQLQREFLPIDLPRLDDLDVHVLFRPASYVSGDIYDVTRLDEQYVGFFIADAVGHGVPAALMTMYIKRSLRMKQSDPSIDSGYRIINPDEALSRLNQDILEQQGGRIRTATACYGLLNFETLELAIARAGHPYPIVLRADGSTELLRPQGAMLGVFAEEQFELVRIQLEPDDRLVMYSDGFEVAFPDAGNRESATNHYVEVFKDLTDGTPAEALHGLSVRLDREAGSLNQSDDLTAMLLAVPSQHRPRRSGIAEHATAIR